MQSVPDTWGFSYKKQRKTKEEKEKTGGNRSF